MGPRKTLDDIYGGIPEEEYKDIRVSNAHLPKGNWAVAVAKGLTHYCLKDWEGQIYLALGSMDSKWVIERDGRGVSSDNHKSSKLRNEESQRG